MKHLTSPFWLAALAGISLVTPAFAVINIDYVTVGNAGNAADNSTGSLYGAVAYAYNISKNETTIYQYAQFLNAIAKTDTYGVYSTSMTNSTINGISRSGISGSYIYSVASGSENKPITYVSWFDAARFTNWLHNGQPVGSQTASTTENGAYELNGASSGSIISKNVGATVWIPSENEWYKAAFYDPNKGGTGLGGYWSRATQSNAMAGNTVGVANSANYYDGDFVGSGTPSFPSLNALTNVGAYGLSSDSAYGTNDQAGNVWEWSCTTIEDPFSLMLGGSWTHATDVPYGNNRLSRPTTFENGDLGFRVASVPEPTSLVLTMFAGGAILLRRKRR